MVTTFNIDGSQANLERFDNNSMHLSIPVEDIKLMVKHSSLVTPRVTENILGLYQIVDMMGKESTKLQSLQMLDFLFQAGRGCVWDPVTGSNKTTDELKVYERKINMEQCNDDFVKCMSVLAGVGNQKTTANSTALAQELLVRTLAALSHQIGNDTYFQLEFGQHPLWTIADENKWYENKVEKSRWERIKKSMSLNPGWSTTIDANDVVSQKPNFQHPINPNHVDGHLFTDDALKMFNEMKSELPHELENDSDAICVVTNGIFNRLKDQIAVRQAGSDFAVELDKYGGDGQVAGQMRLNTRDAIMYDGIVIVRGRGLTLMDSLIGTKTHRMFFISKNVLVAGFDALPDTVGNGLLVKVGMEPENMGKAFYYHRSAIGTAMVSADTNFYGGSLLINPA